ncbi:PorT family protein [Chitinophagales bacterium]|nr:PorT family protein [Chitinophagales bacterium]
MRQLIVLVVLLASCSLFAQNFGVRAGLNYGKFLESAPLADYTAEHRFIPTVHLGLVADVSLSDQTLIQAEILYNVMGTKSTVAGALDESKIRLSYLSVPIAFAYQPIDMLRIYAGGEAGYLMGANQQTAGVSNDITPFYQDFSVGVFGGIQLNTMIGFTIGLRSYLGGTDLLLENDLYDENGILIGSRTARNFNTQLTLGYYFN